MKRTSIIIVFLTLLFAFTVASQGQMQMPKPGPEHKKLDYFLGAWTTDDLLIIGMELAGEVEAVGTAVTEFRVGDDVFGIRGGANAEYVCVREGAPLAHMPVG